METQTTLEVVESVDLTGKTCVITGASAGLGRESARALATTGAHVILAARNMEALRDAEAWIRAELPGAATSTVELDRRLRGRGVRAYSVHPGVVATSLARHMTREDFARLMRLEPADPGQETVDVRHDFQMPEHGAATQVWAAVGKELADVGSVYLADCRVREDVAPYAMDEAHAAELWDLSERLCGSVALGSQP
jgi:NAD(P)-dependent dehydrogenase (short-subunit alcohol dehydrogenase family)